MKILLTAALIGLLCSTVAMAGNDTKRGQSGASELLINPWSRSTGWFGANSGMVRGIESMNLNVAGLAFVNRTDFQLCGQRYLSGSGVTVSSLGFAQKVGQSGVFGLSLTGLSLGDFINTTYSQPEGTGSNFTPQFFNIGLAYSKTFSNSITGGILLRTVYQSVASVEAVGVAFDAGIQYQTGSRNQFKFGVALRNVGPKMAYSGEGLSFRGNRDQIGLTVSSRSAPFEMPTLLNIGASYDFTPVADLRVTPAITFTSNSYTKDNIIPGLELAFKEQFMIRAGYAFYESIGFNESTRTDAHTGVAAGASIALPFGKFTGADNTVEGDAAATADASTLKSKTPARLTLDYSFRNSSPFAGTHAIGLTLSL